VQVADASDLVPGIEALRHALTFGMSPNARDWSRVALKHLEAGDLEEGRRILRRARSYCDGATAARYLRRAADLLGSQSTSP